MTDLPQSPPKVSRWKTFLRSDIVWSYRRSPVTMVASIVAFLLIFMAVFAPLLAPYNPFNPATLNLMDGFTPPNSNSMGGRYFTLGTDSQGRDVLSTIMYGSRVSLFVGAMATLFAMVMGVGLGLVAGYVGGIWDAVIMRVADVQLSFPAILIALLIFGVARGIIPPNQQEGAAIWVLIIAIALPIGRSSPARFAAQPW